VSPVASVRAATDTQTAALQAESGRSSCPDGAAPGAIHGSATITETEDSRVINVSVSLADGEASTTYHVHLLQCLGNDGQRSSTDPTSGAHGDSEIGTFTTDGNGDGTFEGSAPEANGVKSAFVGLVTDDFSSIFATVTVPI
jgi:hypothetical protein